MAAKKRLDVLLVQRKLAKSTEDAQRLIQSGCVEVNGIIRTKIESCHDEQAKITFFVQKQYVGRGGYKLEKALQTFAVQPKDWICLDIGSSTGGFTDCLLQHYAQRVYAVDVGYGILDWKLRTDERVVALERTNARYLTRNDIKDWINLCVIDASFISINVFLEPVLNFFQDEVTIIALVKPQFQLPREKIAAGGIVREQHLQKEAVEMVSNYAGKLGLYTAGVTSSPIRGAKGNQEFLLLLKRKEPLENE